MWSDAGTSVQHAGLLGLSLGLKAKFSGLGIGLETSGLSLGLEAFGLGLVFLALALFKAKVKVTNIQNVGCG